MNNFKRLSLAAVLLILTAVFVSANGITQVPSDTGQSNYAPGQSYYVSREGNDANNGLSERQAFRTFDKAITLASTGGIKHIVIIGVLANDSETNYGETNSKDDDSVFIIRNSGDSEITITGIDEENPGKLQGGNGKRVIGIYGKSRIRFENIYITLGDTKKQGGGIYAVDGAEIILAKNAVINQNEAERGGGISLKNSSLIVRRNAEISCNNGAMDGGGIYANQSYVVLDEDAVLEGNTSECGGGFCIEACSSAIVRGRVKVRENKSWGPQGGGGLCAGLSSNIHMTGGSVTGNVSSNGGGVYIEGAVFTFSNGSITENSAKVGGGVYAGRGGEFYIEDESFVDDNYPDDIFEYDSFDYSGFNFDYDDDDEY